MTQLIVLLRVFTSLILLLWVKEENRRVFSLFDPYLLPLDFLGTVDSNRIILAARRSQLMTIQSLVRGLWVCCSAKSDFMCFFLIFWCAARAEMPDCGCATFLSKHSVGCVEKTLVVVANESQQVFFARWVYLCICCCAVYCMYTLNSVWIPLCVCWSSLEYSHFEHTQCTHTHQHTLHCTIVGSDRCRSTTNFPESVFDQWETRSVPLWNMTLETWRWKVTRTFPMSWRLQRQFLPVCPRESSNTAGYIWHFWIFPHVCKIFWLKLSRSAFTVEYRAVANSWIIESVAQSDAALMSEQSVAFLLYWRKRRY